MRPFLGTTPKPEHFRFLIGLEENGPRIWLAKHFFLAPHQSLVCVPTPILGCELRSGHTGCRNQVQLQS